jgi:hypothetical protein
MTLPTAQTGTTMNDQPTPLPPTPLRPTPLPPTPPAPTPLTEIILSFLTPLMLAAGLTDTALARRAAQEALAAYPPEAPLTATAQVVAFAMATLDNLRLAAPMEVAVTTKLRLRGNANALSRSSRNAAAVQPAPIVRPAAAPPEPRPTRSVELAWADAMTDVAAECARDLAKLPPKQRRAELIRINALNATAQQIRDGRRTLVPVS